MPSIGGRTFDSAGDLGSAYPQGVFVCQDNGNEAPASGNQNFKLTRLERIPLLR
ncbi:MAG TPA: phytase [Dermatophilaceae bacterium]|nr:phytase [Dermatophilaceae bacterium]